MRKILCDACEEEIRSDMYVNNISLDGSADHATKKDFEVCGKCFGHVKSLIERGLKRYKAA